MFQIFFQKMESNLQEINNTLKTLNQKNTILNQEKLENSKKQESILEENASKQNALVTSFSDLNSQIVKQDIPKLKMNEEKLDEWTTQEKKEMKEMQDQFLSQIQLSISNFFQQQTSRMETSSNQIKNKFQNLQIIYRQFQIV